MGSSLAALLVEYHATIALAFPFRPFLASFWPLKSRPPMKSGSCLAFGTHSASMLRHLLVVALCMFSLIQCWDLGPPCWLLEAFLTLFGVILAPEIMPSHAVWILPRFWHAFCFYAPPSAVFCALHVFPLYSAGIYGLSCGLWNPAS